MSRREYYVSIGPGRTWPPSVHLLSTTWFGKGV